MTREDLVEMLQAKCNNHLQHHIHIMYVQYVDLQCIQIYVSEVLYTLSVQIDILYNMYVYDLNTK